MLRAVIGLCPDFWVSSHTWLSRDGSRKEESLRRGLADRTPEPSERMGQETAWWKQVSVVRGAWRRENQSGGCRSHSRERWWCLNWEDPSDVLSPSLPSQCGLSWFVYEKQSEKCLKSVSSSLDRFIFKEFFLKNVIYFLATPYGMWNSLIAHLVKSPPAVQET